MATTSTLTTAPAEFETIAREPIDAEPPAGTEAALSADALPTEPTPPVRPRQGDENETR